MLSALGKSLYALANHFVAAGDNNTPAAPPVTQINRLSANCSRISVNRCEPRALFSELSQSHLRMPPLSST
jgi:hypothetical protein